LRLHRTIYQEYEQGKGQEVPVMKPSKTAKFIGLFLLGSHPKKIPEGVSEGYKDLSFFSTLNDKVTYSRRMLSQKYVDLDFSLIEML